MASGLGGGGDGGNLAGMIVGLASDTNTDGLGVVVVVVVVVVAGA